MKLLFHKYITILYDETDHHIILDFYLFTFSMTSCSDSGGAGIAAATETSSEVDFVFLVPSLLGFNDSGSIPYLNNVDNNFSKFYIVKNEVKFPLSRPRRNRVLS